jgi:hypothetical protein
MRRAAAALLLLFTPALAVAASDALWAKAVAAAGARADWVPGNVTFLLQLVDDKGAAQESWTSRYRLSPGPDGAPAMEVVSSSHNGTDTTAKDKANQQNNRRMPPIRWDEPFDPAVQGVLVLTPRGQKETVDGRSCAVYSFSFAKEDKSTISGTAWVDAATGAPVQVQSIQAPLPRGIFSLSSTLHYARGPTGEGYLREVSLEGVGGILFIKKSFRSVVAVADWWKKTGG